MPLKKQDKFLNYLMTMSLNLHESANYFADYKLKNVSDLKIFFENIKEYELKGDSLVSEVTRDLHNVFITSIEREDILSLTMSMDDVLDGFEHTAALFEMYSIVNADEYMLRFVGAIRNCTAEIGEAVQLLASKKLLSIRDHVMKIKELESKCDGILREAITHLFSKEKDPIRIIQYKGIYEELENIADYCQTVANTLDTIIMKNA
ncbi:DUF47 domain-containing protein [Bacillus sp. 1NLA3E]|uniref:DUF47 domain-containing protein n=1 Tax=Bacillus sp. 1NLA3E TaxID=666686 RepID=UPI000247F197|nr:DUF47 domain-containing protein [Bacillus sp. 1NLA3E]AGK54014.1 phosphate transport regulator [Bacillus sp. 1NLA3E]